MKYGKGIHRNINDDNRNKILITVFIMQVLLKTVVIKIIKVTLKQKIKTINCYEKV